MGGRGLTERGGSVQRRDRPPPADLPGLLASSLAVALLALHAWVLLRDRSMDGAQAMGVLSYQAVVVALLVTGATVRSRGVRAGAYVLGGLGALLYGMLTWNLLGAVDVLAALFAGWGVIRAAMGALGETRP